MKTIIAVVITAIGLIGTIGKSVAESKVPEAHALSVRIETRDDELGNLVNSYVSRELRSLKDVTINESPYSTFVIRCGGLSVEMNGTKLGYAVSLVVTSNRMPLKNIAENKDILNAIDKSFDAQAALRAWCLVTQQFEGQSVFVCSADQLKEHCESFVANFDTKYLNPLRGGGGD
jgi:hypothetical protein